MVIVGTGMYGKLGLLSESRKLVGDKEVYELPTGEAVRLFNELHERRKTLGIFHVTC